MDTNESLEHKFDNDKHMAFVNGLDAFHRELIKIRCRGYDDNWSEYLKRASAPERKGIERLRFYEDTHQVDLAPLLKCAAAVIVDVHDDSAHKLFAQQLTRDDFDLVKMRESVGRGCWSAILPLVPRESWGRIERMRAYESTYCVDLWNFRPPNL